MCDQLTDRHTENYLLANDDWKYDTIPEIMEGKNVADFIDPDIMERLEALEREEEKLEADGFYDSDEDIFDSEDERHAEADTGRKLALAKKHSKNRTNLPRTAGMRTMSEMAQKLTEAGLDPSRLQERAKLLAKARGVKRRADGDEEDMEMDGSGGDDDGEDGMSVDGEADVALKQRTKGKSSAPVSRKGPKTDRRLVGMASEVQAAKATRLRNLGQRARNMHAKAGESDRAIRVKMVSCCATVSPEPELTVISPPAQASFCRQTQDGQDRQAVDAYQPVYHLVFLSLSSVCSLHYTLDMLKFAGCCQQLEGPKPYTAKAENTAYRYEA